MPSNFRIQGRHLRLSFATNLPLDREALTRVVNQTCNKLETWSGSEVMGVLVANGGNLYEILTTFDKTVSRSSEPQIEIMLGPVKTKLQPQPSYRNVRNPSKKFITTNLAVRNTVVEFVKGSAVSDQQRQEEEEEEKVPGEQTGSLSLRRGCGVWKLSDTVFPHRASGSNTQQTNILQKLTSVSSQSDRFDVLCEHFSEKEVLRYFDPLMNNAKTIQDMLIPDDEEEQRGCFPVWVSSRMQELETSHGLIPILKLRKLPHKIKINYRDQIRKHELENCFICQEYRVYDLLQWWYLTFFTISDQAEDYLTNNIMPLYRSDGSIAKKVIPRCKTLVVLGERECGKTKFFESICNHLGHRIVHFKNHFHKAEASKLERAWLILLDDFPFSKNPNTLQSVKSLIAGESTVLDAKWLSKHYKGGLPCVILTNSEDNFQRLLQDPEIFSQCKFIQIPQGIFLGPPSTMNFIPTDDVPNAFYGDKNKRRSEQHNHDDESCKEISEHEVEEGFI